MSSIPNAPVFAAVLAGGTGKRMDESGPKQFVDLGGLPILAHSLLAFERSPHVTGIVLVSHTEHLETAEQIAHNAETSKLVAVVQGGLTRSDSSRAALAALPDGDGLVLIHDAARPLVAQETISAVVDALESHRAAAPALPASDTIAEVHGEEITAIPNRDSLHRVQTPQGFEIATIREAYRLAAQDPVFQASDDCGVVNRYLPDVAIKLVPGSERNLKVTRAQDLRIAETLLDL